MIDIDTAAIRILPSNHIALQDYDGIMKLKKENAQLKNMIFTIAAIGLLILTITLLSNEKSNKPHTSPKKES
jgi:hypothetical protein